MFPTYGLKERKNNYPLKKWSNCIKMYIKKWSSIQKNERIFTNYCVNVNIMGNLAMRNSPILLKFFAGILI